MAKPKYQKAIASIAFLTLILSAGICSGYNFIRSQDNDLFNAKEESILLTFENNDYDGWKKRIGKISQLPSLVTQDQFSKFTSARQAARRGDYDRAVRLAAQLESELKGKITASYLG